MLAKLLKNKKMFKAGGEHAAYVGAVVFSSFTHFVYSVYVKRSIEPLDFGIYSTCLLLQVYLTYIQLGVMNAFNRDYPQLLGAGDVENAQKYRNTAFSYLLLVFFISLIVISASLFLFGDYCQLNSKYKFGFIFCALITFVTIIENFCASRIRIDGNFNYTSFVTVAETISVGIGLYLVYVVGYYALYFTTVINMLIGIGLYYKRGISDISLKIDFGLLKVIIVSGLPLLINGLIWTIVNSIDKIVILSKIDTEALGIYSVAQMAFSYVVLVPHAMSQLFYVKMGKTYGSTKSVEQLCCISESYTKLLAVIVSLIVLCAYFFVDPLVQWVMPNYSNGTRSAQILMLGLAVYAPTMVNSNILTILKENAMLLRGSIYLCILNFICSFGLVVVLGAKIEYVALGSAMSYLIRTVILVVQLKKAANIRPSKMIKASIVPEMLILAPGIMLYYLLDNFTMAFASALFVGVCVATIMYKKNILKVIKESKS